MPIEIGPLTLVEYDGARALWKADPDMAEHVDSRDSIARYLLRNPDISSVAKDGQRVVGVILAGHDGRRGSVWRLAVDGAYRRQGIAARLVDRSLEQLRRADIHRAYLFVFNHNESGRAFWTAQGWKVTGRTVAMWKNLDAPSDNRCS